jgi:hypothetical protein
VLTFVRNIVFSAVLLGNCCAAQAEFTTLRYSGGSSEDICASTTGSILLMAADARAGESGDTTWCVGDSPENGVGDTGSPYVDGLPAQDTVDQLPPGPSSLTLSLGALGFAGAFQLGRSARKLHAGALPHWYHTGGPVQVGRATPMSLEFDLSALPMCTLDRLVIPPVHIHESWGVPPPCRAQCVPVTMTPRGPPSYAARPV